MFITFVSLFDREEIQMLVNRMDNVIDLHLWIQ